MSPVCPWWLGHTVQETPSHAGARSYTLAIVKVAPLGPLQGAGTMFMWPSWSISEGGRLLTSCEHSAHCVPGAHQGVKMSYGGLTRAQSRGHPLLRRHRARKSRGKSDGSEQWGRQGQGQGSRPRTGVRGHGCVMGSHRVTGRQPCQV